MKSLSDTLQEIIANQQSPDYSRSRRSFILELLVTDGTFDERELREIKTALNLVTDEELSIIERELHSGVNTLQIVVELVAMVRLRFGNIFLGY